MDIKLFFRFFVLVGAVQQRFGRNTTHVQTGTTEYLFTFFVLPFFNTGGLKAQLRRTDGSDVTPILNPPQTAILGMHKIQERPMAVNGQVEILPMMYLAVSYDHRMIDGKEAVQFLVTIKEMLEEPARMLLDI